MNVKLTPEQEQIVKDEVNAGHFRTAEEVIAGALQALREQQRSTSHIGVMDKASIAHEMAVKDMLAFVEKNHVRLSGISVKDLIHEGHRL